MKNRNQEIYMSIPEGCNRESRPYKSKVAETPDKDTRGWLGAGIRGWFNINSMLRSFCSESQPYKKAAETFESCGRQLPGWNMYGPWGWSTGFTLMELLVVVLIIGILAVIAVPQYQKAVWRSRNIQLKTLVHNISKAQQSYYMANGQYAENFNELDISLPDWPSRSTTVDPCLRTSANKEDSVRYTNDFQIYIGVDGNVGATWLKGPYQCGGFYKNLSRYLMCTERLNAPFAKGDFCVKIEQAVYDSTPTTWHNYFMP